MKKNIFDVILGIVMAFVIGLMLSKNIYTACLGRVAQTDYPNTLDVASAPLTVDDYVTEAIPNGQNLAIVAIENELGTLPKGTYGNVKLRLDALNPLGKPLNGNGYAINNSSYMEVRAGVADPTEQQTNIQGTGYTLKPPIGWVGAEWEAGYWIMGDVGYANAGIIGWAIGHNSAGDGTMNIYTGGSRMAQINNASGWQFYIGSRTVGTASYFSPYIIDDTNETDLRKNRILNVQKQNGTVYADWRRPVRVYDVLSSSNTKIKVTMSANQEVTATASEQIEFDKIETGYDDIWGEFNTGTYTFTPAKSGFYWITVNVYGEAVVGTWVVDIVKNSQVVNSQNGNVYSANITELVKMDAGDEVIFVATNNSAVNHNIYDYTQSAHCSVSITRVP